MRGRARCWCRTGRWASDATVPLTTKMLAEYKANPAQGKAEAHRKSMLALMDSADHPEFAPSIYWAPFVVVGEGGAGLRIHDVGFLLFAGFTGTAGLNPRHAGT